MTVAGQVATMPGTDWQEGMRTQLLSRGLAPRTVTLYEQIVRRADMWWNASNRRLAVASAGEVAEYLLEVPNSYSSRKNLSCALRSYWMVVGHPNPPTGAIRMPPKPEGECRALEEGDVRILGKAARTRGDRKGLAVAIALYTGMRRAELARLRWDAFGDDGWVRWVGKREKARKLPIHARLTKLLAEAPRDGPYVFMGRFGGPVTPATIWAWVREVSTDAGVPTIAPHVCRHIAIATGNDRTRDLRAAQAFAGHSNPAQTAVYTRASTRRLRAIVDSLDY